MEANTELMEISYENRLVAFLDVMGFQELLKDPQAVKLNQYFRQVRKTMADKSATFHGLSTEQKFRKILFSDSIILSIELSSERNEDVARIAHFFHSISRLQYDLATSCDIWTRGAVSFGKLHINEATNEMVGTAFISAYNLEKFADYPRIVIAPKVCTSVGLNPPEFVSRINNCQYEGKLVEIQEQRRLASSLDEMQTEYFFDLTHTKPRCCHDGASLVGN
ncbi:MAG: hypothetical protein NDI61_06205 [Bdellovibrionaceae bacterium]|nr:hypothetical protein [Pseudobdellovibrionaceae bacterium]